MSPKVIAAPLQYLSPWFYGWNVLAVGIFSMAVAIGLGISAFSFFAIQWMEEFGTSRGETILVLSSAQILSGFIAPFSGRAMDRLQIRWVGSAGILALTLGLLLSSLATQLWQLFLSYSLFLAATIAMSGTLFSQTLATRWFRGRRGLALGLAALGSSIGTMFMPLSVAMLLEVVDWRIVMRIVALLASVLMIPSILLIVRDSPEQCGIQPEPEGRLSARPAAAPAWTTLRILREPYFWFMIIAVMPLALGSAAISGNLAPLARDLGVSAQAAGFLMTTSSMAAIMAKVGFGFLADRIAPWRLLVVAMLCKLAGLMVIILVPGYTAMLVVMFTIGMGVGSYVPLVSTLIGKHFGPLAFGSVIGLYVLFARPIAFAAPIAGWVRDMTGSYSPFWLGLVVVCGCSLPFAWQLKEKHPAEPGPTNHLDSDRDGSAGL